MTGGPMEHCCLRGYLNTRYVTSMNFHTADAENKRLHSSMPVSSGASPAGRAWPCMKECVARQTRVAQRLHSRRVPGDSQGTHMTMRDPVLPENHRVYRMLPWIVPNGQHKINAANRGPPHHFSENGLFVLLVLLVNPALAVIPSHHPDDTGGN